MVSGTKNTSDPEAQNKPVYEGGFVTSDSLAADSLNADGGYGGTKNPHAAISSQPSDSTTTNVTDTSAAERLGPIQDGGSRTNKESAEDTFDEGRIDPYTHKPMGVGATLDSNNDTSKPVGNTNDPIPSDSTPVDSASSDSKTSRAPRKSKQENGPDFDDTAPNASFNQDVGGPNDPGRVAEHEFEKRNNENAADFGKAHDMKVDSVTKYDTLKEGPAPDATGGNVGKGNTNGNVNDDESRRDTNASNGTPTTKPNQSQSDGSGASSTGLKDSLLSSTKGTRSDSEKENYSKSTTDSTPHYSNSTPESKQSHPKMKTNSSTSTQDTRVESTQDNRPMNESIDERQDNLPLPDQPPVASDWQSMDERNVNI